MGTYFDQANRYKSVDLQTRIEAASPYELINLMFQGAKTHLAAAKGTLLRGQIKEKCEHIDKAIGIIDGLKASLNRENQQSADMANNLFQFYSTIQQLLLKANMKNDVDLLDKCSQLLEEIHGAWREIKPSEDDIK